MRFGHLNSRSRVGAAALTLIVVAAAACVPAPQPPTGVHVVEVATGTTHACARASDGTVRCWGWASSGQLGAGPVNSTQFSAIPVEGIDTATSLDVGPRHACVGLADGSARCWGSAANGQLGDGISGFGMFADTPVEVLGLEGVVDVAVGMAHSCALIDDGSVQCWGLANFGQVGDGTFVDSSTPQPVVGLSDVTSIELGERHSCAVRADGTLHCWGQNNLLQLGRPLAEIGAQWAVPIEVPLGRSVRTVSAGASSTCVVYVDTEGHCWGDAADGRLGNGIYTGALLPSASPTLGPGWEAIVTGTPVSCGVAIGGILNCWGRLGRIGTFEPDPGLDPVEVPMAGTATGVSQSLGQVCVLRLSGEVGCSGWDGDGPKGNGSAVTGRRWLPVVGLPLGGSLTAIDPLPSLAGVTSIATDHRNTCATTVSGTLMCWGRDMRLSAGYGTDTQFFAQPHWSITDVVAVDRGRVTGCAVHTGGGVSCWGDNDNGEGGGELGDWVDGPVAGIADAVDVSVGWTHSCALLADATVSCWGRRSGNGPNGETLFLDPTDDYGLVGVTQVVVGNYQTCALLAGGTVSCWGQPFSWEAPYGSDDLPPHELPNLTGVRAISEGNPSCAVLETGAVRCWGAAAPTDHPWLENVTAIDGNEYHGCALLDGGAVQCWGHNDSGQLGDGTYLDSPTPVDTDISGAVSLSVDIDSSCAVLGDGTARCWGNNGNGELGNPGGVSNLPVDVATMPPGYLHE